MNTWLSLLTTALIWSSAAFAAEKEKPKRPTSAEERESKRYTGDVQPITLFVGSLHSGTTQGVSAGRLVQPDLIARVTLRGGSSCTSERCAYVERTFSITAQKFVGNSFFIEPGLGIQRNIYHPEDDNAFSGDKREYHFTYTVENWGPVFAIGNQWQWGAFTLGARWAAVFQSLFSREAKIHEDAPDRYQTGDNEKDELRDFQDERKLYVASLALGSSF